MRTTIALGMICVVIGCASLTGCGSIAKSLGGVWYRPELAIAPGNDAVAIELMAKYRDKITAYLAHFTSENGDRKIDVLENNLIEGGTAFVAFRDNYYLELGIKRKVTYNTGQAAGLVDTPRKRAEKDFHACVLSMIKEYPQDFLQADFTGLIIATTHTYKGLSAFESEKTETVRFHFEHDLIARFRNLEFSVEDLLQRALVTANDVRI